MTTEHMRRLLDARPFEPFAVHLADQRQFRVAHPEVAVLWRSGRTIIVMNDDRTPEIIDMLLVTSLRVLPAAETTADFSR